MKNHLVSREDVEHRMELGYGPMKLKYGNWATMATAVEHEFAVVSDKDGLEDLLKRAQIAILNPSIDCQSFLEGPLPSIEQCEAEFSPNYISLAIQGPGLPTLSFYDLPGVIHTMPDERKDYLVGAVRDMTSEYVADESSLVLLACSMEGDIQNSTASGIVRSLKATHRCLGVLTKPDRFPQGDPIDIWRKCLSGTAYPLGYGYFITRQPAQYQLDNGMTHAQARYQEARFFDQGPLWAQELYAFRDCFGTKNLQNKLSIELAGQIVKKYVAFR